jgi:hypothetical protein
MPQYNAAQQRARDTFKMLMSITDVRLRQKRSRELPPLVVKVSELSPQAYCALMQMRGALPGASPEQLVEAERVFGSVIDRATQIAVVSKGLQELDEMGIGLFVNMPDGTHFFCYPNLDLAVEATPASQIG